MPPRARTRKPGLSPLAPEHIPLAPVVLLRGTEDYFVDAVSDHLLDLARTRARELYTPEADPDAPIPLEVVRADAVGYRAGMIDAWLSPSLFEEPRHVVVDNVQDANDDFLTDALEHVEHIGAEPGETSLVLCHHGGQRGKRLLDLIAARGLPVVACDPLKDREKADFAMGLFRAARRSVDRETVEGLVEALGSDLRELASACRQLMEDSTGRITRDLVDLYYGGRVEATGFEVADAAIAGDAARAVTLTRHALATGLDPVPLVAVLGMKLRAMASVSAMRGRGLAAKDLRMAPWQIDRARRDLQGWSPAALAEAIVAVARADADVKGQTSDRAFAVERAVLTVATAR